MMNRLRFLAAALTLATLDLPCAAMAQESFQYQVVKTVPLGAPDRWDYVAFDAGSGRVYVAHGDEVTIVNGDTGELVGHVRGFPGITHGIVLVDAGNRGYTDEGETGRAASFDLTSLAIQKRIPAAEGADAMAFDPVSNHVFVMNGDAGTITVIDAKTDTAIATIQVGGGLEFAVAGEQGRLFVNGASRRELVSVDTKDNHIAGRWPLPDCESPHGLAIDPREHRLFVSCLNQILKVVDSRSGHVVATVPIGRGTDAVAFDPQRRLVFSSNGRDGTISVIHEQDANTFVPLQPIRTAVSARTMSINPATGRLFLAQADVDPSVQPDKKRGRVPVIPGSLKLVFLDPKP